MKIPLPRSLRLGLCAASCAVVAAALAAPAHAAPLSDADVKFLTLYEQVQKALVTGNLDGARQAAHALPGGEGADLEKSKDIKEARNAFAVISQRAEKLVAGNPAYHVFNCPMVNKDWVQTTTTIANPYMGADMLTCGVEKKNP